MAVRLEVLYGALPARDEAGYDMQGHRQEVQPAGRPWDRLVMMLPPFGFCPDFRLKMLVFVRG